MALYRASIESPLGPITLEASDEYLTSVRLRALGKTTPERSEVLERAITQIREYFAGRRKHFTIPLAIQGTDFQKQVWQALEEIPFGETCSYGDIAKRIGNAPAVRAVGGALGKNHLPLILPCHRVTAAQGKIGGFTGGLDLKKWLLNFEKGLRD
jgi:methylated-DNA-[protein]-cysteine S-methyltransferase